MEKRTILAFVLSFLVLILWTHLFQPVRKQGPKEDHAIKKDIPQKVAQTPRPSAEEILEPSPAPLEQKPMPKAPKMGKKEIEIQTPLYQAVFSNVGPTIKSFKLKKYHQTVDPDSPLIELVAVEPETADFFTIDFKSPSLQGDTAFQTDQERIRLAPGDRPREIIFQKQAPNGLVIKKIFRFYADQYKIDADIAVSNRSSTRQQGEFTTAINARPQEKGGYYSYVGLAFFLDGEIEEMELEDPPESRETSGPIKWVAYENDYFISAVIPENRQPAVFKGSLSASGLLAGVYQQPTVFLEPSRQVATSFTLYFGPRDLQILKEIGHDLDKAVDYGWFDVIAKGLFSILLFFNGFVHNYGISIILLTVLIKVIFWPLTHKSYKSMKEMQKLQPIMAKIRERYKEDKQKMNAEMMNLYKTYKVNPLGGCLPMLIQLPVFFALFRLLGSSIELRHAPFMLWINDLSAPDRLFNFPIDYIPYMEKPYGIPVLTLLMGASMFLQQKMTPTPGDPAQAKMMMLMPVIFTFMFINFPSGLVLYWLLNNVLSIGQQYRILKKTG